MTTLRSRRARGEHVALTQIIAAEQLRTREEMMRKPKPTTTATTTNDAKRMNSFIFALVIYYL